MEARHRRARRPRSPPRPSAEPDPTAPRAFGAAALSRRGFLRVAGVAGLDGRRRDRRRVHRPPRPRSGASAPRAARAGARDDRAGAAPVRLRVRGSGVGAARLGTARRAPRRRADPNLPAGWTEHDIAARNVVRRFVGNLAPALQGIFGDEAFAKLADMLGGDEDASPSSAVKPAFAQVPQLVLNDALDPLEPETDGEWTVFRHHDRRDRAADRRAQADGRRARLQRADARPHDPRPRGRPRSARSSPTTSRRRPASTSTASSSTTSSWTASRS